MGLSTKQVPGDQALDWSQTLLESAGTVEFPKPPPIRRQQQQQQQSEPLNCPRCGSTNTKFCYYNNYNKSQPRHFCKACKRHWTNGGTLRNVPVGGGRKNKRLKASSVPRSSNATTSNTIPTSTSNGNNVHVVDQNQQDSHNFPLRALGDQKNISDILYQALINGSSSVQHDPINAYTSKTLIGTKGTSTGPMLSLPQDQNLQLSFSSISPFENIPSPIPSFNQPLNGYDYGGKLDSMESSTTTTVTPATSSIFSQPWQGPTTSSVMAEMPNYWNWNDIDTFVSADLNIPWDDTEIKP